MLKLIVAGLTLAGGNLFASATALSIVSATAIVSSAVASEEPESRPTFSPGDPNDPKAPLLVYDAAYCDEDNRDECPLVTFACDGDGQFLVTIEDLSDQEVASWLMQKDGMSLVVSGEELSNSDNATSIAKNDMNGTWGVSFGVNGAELPLTASEMVFETIAGTLTIPVSPQGKASLGRLISACR